MNKSSPFANSNSNTKPMLPPRAPLALRIGVTGHRTEPDDLPDEKRKRPIPDEAYIHRSVIEVLKVIGASFKGVSETSSEYFAGTEINEQRPFGGSLRIISGLASGADQWVTEAAVALGYELQCILPFDRDNYRQDFSDGIEAKTYESLLAKATSVLELDGRADVDENGSRKPDSSSYEALGKVLINQSDLIIAVWDGENAHGRGGTGQVVVEALQNGVPVVWIPWKSTGKWRLFHPSWRLLDQPADLKDESERLKETVSGLLLPPFSNTKNGSKCQDSLLDEYFREKQKKGNPHLGWWMVFRALICGEICKKGLKGIISEFRVKNFEDTEKEKAASYWNTESEKGNSGSSEDSNLLKWLIEKYMKHYAWANGLSRYYGNMHRSAFVMNYLLGAIAVFLALVCIALGIHGKLQAGWIISELVVILGILILTNRGRKKRWHQRWIDYRTLAEYLRLARSRVLLGGGSLQVAYEGHLSGYGNPAHTWMNWHYRAIERAAGLPNVVFTGDYLKKCSNLWVKGLVQRQIVYHRDAHKRFSKMDRRLHHAGDFLFIGTLFACVIHLAHLWLEHNPKFDWIPESTGNWMTLLCAFLPALGAALAAIRNHGEVQRLAQRSNAMEETLTHLNREMASEIIEEGSLASSRLRYHTDQVSNLMTNEFLDWRVVFQDRPLGLPT